MKASELNWILDECLGVFTPESPFDTVVGSTEGFVFYVLTAGRTEVSEAQTRSLQLLLDLPPSTVNDINKAALFFETTEPLILTDERYYGGLELNEASISDFFKLEYIVVPVHDQVSDSYFFINGVCEWLGRFFLMFKDGKLTHIGRGFGGEELEFLQSVSQLIDKGFAHPVP